MKNFKKMIVEQMFYYYLLKIWDGRYAAFWHVGFHSDAHMDAIRDNYISEETTWPFAFISESIEEVRKYIISEEIQFTRNQHDDEMDLTSIADILSKYYSEKNYWMTRKHKRKISVEYMRKVLGA